MHTHFEGWLEKKYVYVSLCHRSILRLVMWLLPLYVIARFCWMQNRPAIFEFNEHTADGFLCWGASLKNIVGPLTKCIRISKDDWRRTDPLTKRMRISRDDFRRADPFDEMQTHFEGWQEEQIPWRFWLSSKTRDDKKKWVFISLPKIERWLEREKNLLFDHAY